MALKFGTVNGNAREAIFWASRAPISQDVVESFFQKAFLSYQHIEYFACYDSAIWSANSSNYIGLDAARIDAIDEHEISKAGLV